MQFDLTTVFPGLANEGCLNAMRITEFLQSILGNGDLYSRLFLGLLAAIAAWMICLPFFEFAQRAALNRYQLQNRFYPAWAMQQIVPSIYNFENEYRFESANPRPDPELAAFTRTKRLNHFPLRIVTYFDGRYRLFHEGHGGILRVNSRFQDIELETDWQIDAQPDGSLRMTLRTNRCNHKSFCSSIYCILHIFNA